MKRYPVSCDIGVRRRRPAHISGAVVMSGFVVVPGTTGFKFRCHRYRISGSTSIEAPNYFAIYPLPRAMPPIRVIVFLFRWALLPITWLE